MVTGGSGFIGTHTCLELINAGVNVSIIDNFSNSVGESLERIERLSGKKVSFYEVDIRNKNSLQEVFKASDFSAVIHFAGLKAVGESVSYPVRYYQNNVLGTLNLLDVMSQYNVRKLVFSSSATVYGDPETLPIKEFFPRSATNPYGQSKLMVEHILEDLAKADPEWKIACLRYFNPVGAHSSGMIGEDPQDIPNNLMPYISQVAVGKREKLSIFGNDYPTVDGTGVRDYIHVTDLAKGHLAALNYLYSEQAESFSPFNLGRGQGISVLQLVNAFEKASGRKIPYEVVNRRPGDIAACYADAQRAKQLLGWKAHLGVEDMCKDAWRWQEMNPTGYK
ncbi:UDP-glucose 4-epimerase GalE [Halomonas sp. XH26]|uniref:UDP-glucose 4-epimerase GalE n=1 Tax=Halomonas sp. XH26 TaxID=2557993 RepID=UPI00209DD744|nr:UDP-glucose 4-epimerase GalE [Halomonas sp. XH26]